MAARTPFGIQQDVEMTNLERMIKNYGNLLQMIPNFADSFKKMFDQTLADIKPFYQGWQPSPNTPQAIYETLTNITPVTPTNTGIPYIDFMTNKYSGYGQGYLDYLRGLEGKLNISPQDLVEWDKFFESINERFSKIQGSLAQSIGGAFLDSQNTQGFQGFEDSLKQKLAQSVINGLAQGFTNKALDIVMNSSTGMAGAFGLMEQLGNQEGGVTSADVISAFKASFSQLDTIFTAIQPIFTEFSTGIQALIEQLGINTDAISSNTDALIGPVEAFLRDLQVGQFAPIQSLEAMKTTYEQLLADAIANPSDFSTFAGFAQSDYIPFGREISPDYSQFIGGIKSDVMDIPWYASKVAAPGSSPSAAEIGNAVAAAVSPLLLNDQKEIHIHLNINGREIATEVLNEVENSVQLTRKLSRAIR